MSDDGHDGAEPLLDTPEPESTDDSTVDTDDGKETVVAEQEKKEGLELEVPEKKPEDKAPTKAEAKKQNQIDAWQKKLDDGTHTVDDLPKNMSWLEEHLTVAEEAAAPSKDSVKDVAREVLQEERAEMRFRELKTELVNADLEPEVIVKINKRYASLIEKGLSPLDAIEAATEMAGVDFEQEAIDTKRDSMAMPRLGKLKRTKEGAVDYDNTPYSEIVEKVPEAERQKALRESIKSAQGISKY